ncbi:MAG: TrkH family potassium uptake protein [Planctomycetes bacterium]|nr:TrkH family potassium uptake protein [Planctomycetota bacterium]
MNPAVIAKVLGMLLIVLGCISAVPITAALYSAEDIAPWVIMALVFFVSGISLLIIGRKSIPEKDLGISEGMAITTLFWTISSAISAIGLWHASPGIGFIHAWFESMSGLTTTGSTIFGSHINDAGIEIGTLIVDLDNSVKIWRALLEWMGGIGIVVISIALIPLLIGGSGFQMYRAEMPGLSADRLAPRLATTARIILGLYVIFTALISIALYLSDVPLFHAICHAMTTVSTGGFSTFDNSVEGLQSHAAEWIIILGMILGAINFSIIVSSIRGKPLSIWHNSEARTFLCLLLIAWAAVAVSLGCCDDLYAGHTGDLIRDSLFQVVSIGTSTGYGTGYDTHPEAWTAWPSFAVCIIIMCMICGGCAGSTAGGMKLVRILIAIRACRRELRRFMEPARITPMTLDNRPINDRIVLQVAAFIALYAFSFILGGLALAMCGNSLEVSFSASLSAISNIGPALGDVGPSRNFRGLNQPSLCISIFLMLLGRLEFFGVLMTLRPKHWRR